MSFEASPEPTSSQVIRVESLSPTVRRLVLEAAAPLAWRAGQHVALRRQADRGPDSYYSFASAVSAAEPHHFELAVGRGPATIGELELGDRVFASGPLGLAMLDALPSTGPLVLLAMGTGVAPLRAVLQEYQRGRQEGRRPERKLTLIHGAREFSESLFAAEFRRAAEQGWLDYEPVLSRPSTGWAGLSGWVQDQLEGRVTADAACLICGSVPMVEATRARLLARGVAPEAILAEGY